MVVRDLGHVDYLPTIEAMKAFTQARGLETPDELWVLEHPPVFTQGIGGKEEHLLAPGDIEVIRTDRGGQVTPRKDLASPVRTLSTITTFLIKSPI